MVVHSASSNGHSPRLPEARTALAELITQGVDKEKLGKAVSGLRNSQQFAGLDEVLIELGLDEFLETDFAGTLYSEIERREIRWLWKGRLAFGKITTLDGNPGEGKSHILCNIAARYSRGQPMPGEDEALAPAGGVVLVMVEDDPSDTIIHRLERVNADLSRICHLAEIPAGAICGIPITRSFNLHTDLPLLIREIKRVNAGLLILDPLAGLIGKTSTNDSADMYSVLDPLAGIARALDVAVIFTRHLNKREAETSLYRGAGSMAIIGRARFGLIVGQDPDDETTNVLANHKNNVSRKAPSLSYQVTNDEESGDPRPYVLWKGVNQHSMKELFPGKRESPLGATKQKIIEALDRAKVPMMPKDIAEETGIAFGNLYVTLGRMEKDGLVQKTAHGHYCLPTTEDVSTEHSESEVLG